jgi:uncharacterized protein YdbL (DUF1318 family)
MKSLLARFLLVPAALVLTVATVHAEDLNAVKARIAERLPSIDTLKAGGAIGENNRGFVEVRGGGGDAVSVTSAENADREVVYAAIAAQSGTSASVVGSARAKQIAAHSAPGVWLQADSGTWYKK